jgi:hypothetical protein
MPLYTDIQSHTSIHSSEVDLFRGFMKALRGIGYTDELHGIKHQAQFDNPLNATKHVNCEICDILIFVYNGTQARFTFLQNKKKFSKKYKGINNISLPLRQRYLLGNFPQIFMKNKEKHIPADIFSNRSLDSIGSLGVFYIDASGRINMDYSIMSLMSTTKSFNASDYDKNHNRTYTFSGNINNIRTVHSFEEVEACINLPEFENHLLNMKVGEPLEKLEKSYANYILSSIEETISMDPFDENRDILSDIQEIRREHEIKKQDFNRRSVPTFHVAVINTKKNKT